MGSTFLSPIHAFTIFYSDFTFKGEEQDISFVFISFALAIVSVIATFILYFLVAIKVFDLKRTKFNDHGFYLYLG